MKKLIIVYSRVSSRAQSLREQIDAAKKLLKVRNIREEDVLFLEDFDVSATKNDIENRPAFSRLLQLVSENKVETIILYARDRAYRDFYEAARFNAMVNLHNVEVIYTATNQNPFYKNTSIEGYFGIIAQQEGENIRRRTADAIKRYPGNTIGYQRIESRTKDGKKNVTFTKDGDRSVLIEALFEEFSRIQTDDEFVAILRKYGKDLSGHATVMKILRRLFYAAHCETDYGYDKLAHVEPIVTLELFEKVQETLNKYEAKYEEEVTYGQDKIWFNPVCGLCNKRMTFKKALDKPSYFTCSNRHKNLSVELDDLNLAIEETLLKEMKDFTLSTYEPIFQTHLKGVLDKLTHQKQHKAELLDKNSLALASGDLFRNTKAKKLQSKIRTAEEDIEAINREIELLHLVKNEVRTIANIVHPAMNQLMKSDLDTLVELLIKQILIHHDFVEINMYVLFHVEEGVS